MNYEQTVHEIICDHMTNVEQHVSSAKLNGRLSPADWDILEAIKELKKAVQLLSRTTTRGVYP